MGRTKNQTRHKRVVDLLIKHNWRHMWATDKPLFPEANYELDCWASCGQVLLLQVFDDNHGVVIFHACVPNDGKSIEPWLVELTEQRRSTGAHHSVTGAMLTSWWKDDRQQEVIENLRNRHPAITAGWIVQAAQDKTLTLVECNAIANLLSDDQVKMRDTYGLDPKGWPPPTEA